MRPLALLLLLPAGVTGCATVSPDAWLRPDQGVLTTPGIVIEAEDHSFRIVSGQHFRTPFWAYDCPGTATTQNTALAERLGGRRVRVQYPGRPEPLHGIVTFCHVHPSVTGPLTRMYDVRIPDEYVAATGGGLISFVVEPSGFVRRYSDGDYDLPAWILWLSQEPFLPPGDSSSGSVPR